MFRRIGGILAFAGVCALSVFLVNCGTSSSRPSGILYVVSQVQNNISTFAVDLHSGNLGLVNSNASTCTTSPCGLPLDISLDSKAASAFVLNQGVPNASPAIAPTVYGYTVGSDGSFGSPAVAATLDVNPAETGVAMARDTSNQFLFVITQGVGFPTDCDSTYDPNCPALYVFTTQTGSTTLTLANNTCLGPTAPCPYQLPKIPTSVSAITFTPQGGSAKTVLFVTSNQDLHQPPNDNTVSVYSVDSAGNITANGIYTTDVNPTVVLAVNTTPSSGGNSGGIFVYVGNSGATAGSLRFWELCSSVNAVCTQQDVDNNLLIAGTGAPAVGQNPVAMLVDPSNTFLYVAANGSNQVFGFRIASTTGELTALSPASQSTGTEPVALAMHGSNNQSDEFLYVSNNASSNITGFTVGAVTGTMSNPVSVVFTPGGPSGMAGK